MRFICRYSLVFLLLAYLAFLSACSAFFGDRTDTDFLDEPTFDNRPVAYVPILPVIEGLVRPVDVIAGWDELIYVADQGTESIISFDQAGNEQGRFMIPGLSAIAQDRRLNILAIGKLDTLINNTPLSLSTLYRIELNSPSGYSLNNARISNRIIHPFYFKSSAPTLADQEVSFRGVAVLADNSFYIARNGPNNDVNKFGGADDAILNFDEADQFISPIFITTSLGLVRDYFAKPQGISTPVVPPQGPANSGAFRFVQGGDFAFTSLSENTVLSVQIIEDAVVENGLVFRQRFLAQDPNSADRFLYEPNRFRAPVDISYSGDGTNYLFVVDASKDSLYQFIASSGFEGIAPPPGFGGIKVIRTSFGGTGDGLTQFREPSGVAYLNRIVYVADAGNGRLLRFRLTTDFD